MVTLRHVQPFESFTCLVRWTAPTHCKCVGQVTSVPHIFYRKLNLSTRSQPESSLAIGTAICRDEA